MLPTFVESKSASFYKYSSSAYDVLGPELDARTQQPAQESP